jgi:hypothetical protein
VRRSKVEPAEAAFYAYAASTLVTCWLSAPNAKLKNSAPSAAPGRKRRRRRIVMGSNFPEDANGSTRSGTSLVEAQSAPHLTSSTCRIDTAWHATCTRSGSLRSQVTLHSAEPHPAT